ncbi:GmrSD restriction endonuclease domain-containing protein [Corynebacterium halotolerans]|uniref:GmrSD restriction endonuclease domain-containing protein n=1 Tax=Corynebacterium halotolerans TaxID=225326 RepID=UPI003CECCFF7
MRTPRCPPPPTPAPGSGEEATSINEQGGGGATGSALAALEVLTVKGRAPKTGYDREQFGPRWADVDRNGCDTRNDILARDLQAETFDPDTQNCVVLTGILDDPYTATEIHFQRGQDTSEAVQIDHVVDLSDAWQKGAQHLDETTRTAFANDPLNLLAVDGPTNAQKGDGDAATWLPANRSFRCDYIARQIAVKARYHLWVTAAEKDAMARVLTDCPDQVLPTDETAATAYQVDTTAPQSPTLEPAPRFPAAEPPAPAPAPEPLAPALAPAPAPQAPVQGGTDPQFTSCAKAKAAGHGPYTAGIDPEYHWYGDGDNDGINCE